MPGVKGRSGAPGRPKPYAGRKRTLTPVTVLRLSPDAAQKLAIVTKSRRHLTGNMQLSQRQVVESWIDEAWREIDERWVEIEQAALEMMDEAARNGTQP